MSEELSYSFNGRPVRVVGTPDEPWFHAQDACDAMGIAESRSALRDLDDDEKGVLSTHTLGGVQNMLYVSESGLFSITLKSRKPEAVAFKKWITKEVLPAIRKTGSYSTTSFDPTKMEPAARLQWEIKTLQSLAAQMEITNHQVGVIVAQAEVIDEKNLIIEEQAPAVDFLEAVTVSGKSYTLEEAAKMVMILKANGDYMGRNDLAKLLKRHHYIHDANGRGNKPLQEHVNAGLFEFGYSKEWRNAKTGKLNKTPTTHVLPKGINKIIKEFGGEGELLPVEKKPRVKQPKPPTP